MVRRAPFVHQAGWNAFLIDLRHHGASGGETTTFGVKEKEDVEAAVRLARERSPGPVVVWGVSLGAASVVFAAAEDPEVRGVICDSSFRSLDDTVRHHLQLFRGFRWWLRIVPSWPVADLAIFWMGQRGGFDTAAADVLAAAAHLKGRPALFVANSDDRRMPKEIAFDLQAAAGPGAEVLIVPGKSHGGAWRDGTPAYEAAAAALLERARPAAATLAAGPSRADSLAAP
jgi:pimeloyl-ACP methyl ester carboxylesterase